MDWVNWYTSFSLEREVPIQFWLAGGTFDAPQVSPFTSVGVEETLQASKPVWRETWLNETIPLVEERLLGVNDLIFMCIFRTKDNHLCVTHRHGSKLPCLPSAICGLLHMFIPAVWHCYRRVWLDKSALTLPEQSVAVSKGTWRKRETFPADVYFSRRDWDNTIYFHLD